MTRAPMRPAAMLISPSAPHGTSCCMASVAFMNGLTSVPSGTVKKPLGLKILFMCGFGSTTRRH